MTTPTNAQPPRASTLGDTEVSGLVALHRRVVSNERGVGLAILRVLLVFPALAYAAIATIRNALYDRGILPSVRAEARVISVGNLTAGGTGKTPVVIALARAALRAGLRPAVLIRGYRKAGSSESDEARLLERALSGVPVVVGPERARSAQIAIAHGADLLLLDDGFQHRRLARDVDVVLLDARDPFGGGWQLPRGFRREPQRGLRRARVVILTRADRVGGRGEPRIEQLIADVRRAAARPDLPVLLENHRATALVDRQGAVVASIAELRAVRVFVFSGIGDPHTLSETVRAVGAEVVGSSTFPDHHEYREDDLRRIFVAATAANAQRIVTTEKDLVRLEGRHLEREITALRIEAEFDGGDCALEGERLLGFEWVTPPSA